MLKTFLNNKKILSFHFWYSTINSQFISKKKASKNVKNLFHWVLLFSEEQLSSQNILYQKKKKTNKTKQNRKTKIQKRNKKKLQSLSTIDFSNDHILKIIRKFPPNIAHRHDGKIFDYSIWKLLKLIFQSYLKRTKFPSEWKTRTWFQFIKKLLTVTANQYY